MWRPRADEVVSRRDSRLVRTVPTADNKRATTPRRKRAHARPQLGVQHTRLRCWKAARQSLAKRGLASQLPKRCNEKSGLHRCKRGEAGHIGGELAGALRALRTGLSGASQGVPGPCDPGPGTARWSRTVRKLARGRPGNGWSRRAYQASERRRRRVHMKEQLYWRACGSCAQRNLPAARPRAALWRVGALVERQRISTPGCCHLKTQNRRSFRPSSRFRGS